MRLGRGGEEPGNFIAINLRSKGTSSHLLGHGGILQLIEAGHAGQEQVPQTGLTSFLLQLFHEWRYGPLGVWVCGVGIHLLKYM